MFLVSKQNTSSKPNPNLKTFKIIKLKQQLIKMFKKQTYPISYNRTEGLSENKENKGGERWEKWAKDSWQLLRERRKNITVSN